MLNAAQTIFNRLARADREHQKEAAGSLLLSGLRYVCAFILAAFVLDVALHLEVGWRLGLLGAFAFGVLSLFGISLYLAYVRRNPLEHIARFLESRHSQLGSKLINLLQLNEQNQASSLSPLTRNLARQAVDDYAAAMGPVPLERLARTNRLRRALQRTAWALLIFGAMLAGFFRVTAVEFLRFADPYGDHPPYSFTQLEIRQPGPDGTYVIYGKNCLVEVQASGHTPKEVLISAYPPDHPERTVTLSMFDKGRDGFRQQLENIREPLLVYAHTRDKQSLSKTVRIGLVLTPQLEAAAVQITPPPYTGLRTEDKPYHFQSVQALEGSRIQFRFRSNRPLREGLLEFGNGDQAPVRVPMKPNPEDETEVTGRIDAQVSGRFRFSLVDTNGLPSQTNWEGALIVTRDLPPEIRITEPDHDSFVAMDFHLKAGLEASDDYGLSAIRWHRALNGVYSPPKVISYTNLVRSARDEISFPIADLGVRPGDVISLFAEAVDTAPQPHLARSQTLRLTLISVEEYNQFLLEQTDLADLEFKYRALTEELNQLAEAQKTLGEDAEKLREELAQAGSESQERRAELAEKLDALLARQNELNQKVNQEAERMEQFVRDQPLYDVEKDLQKQLREQAQALRQSATNNGATARSVAQQSSPSAGPRQLTPDMLDQFQKASDRQLAQLGGAKKETEKRVLDTIEDLALMQELIKDFNQFEDLYRAQQELAGQTRAYDRAGDLSREDQLALKSLAATERDVAGFLEQLEGKLDEDAQAAGKLFPKAAQSGRFLAGKIRELRLPNQAHQATEAMLAARGDQSHLRAERLRGDMESLFSECRSSGSCPSSGELDQFLKLTRNFNPGNNFKQMSRSRKYGQPGQPHSGLGMGQGQGGQAGYAVVDGDQLGVLGNEKVAGRGDARARPKGKRGRGRAESPGDLAQTTTEKSEALKGLNPINRQSGAVNSESLIEEYSDVVDTYFKAITTRKQP
jgi:hypothetical protein